VLSFLGGIDIRELDETPQDTPLHGNVERLERKLVLPPHFLGKKRNQHLVDGGVLAAHPSEVVSVDGKRFALLERRNRGRATGLLRGEGHLTEAIPLPPNRDRRRIPERTLQNGTNLGKKVYD
jgi:hypothetical protein